MIIPHTDITLETDLQQNIPSNYIIHTQRIWLDDVSEEAEKRMVDHDLELGIKYLQGITNYDSAVFGCTSASVVYGKEGLERIENLLAKKLNCKAISAFKSVINEISRVKASKVALLTPYSKSVNKFMKNTLEYFGINIVYDNGIGIYDDKEISNISTDKIYNFVNENKNNLKDSKADLCFISCTNLRSMEIREDLEKMLEIPVITSNYCIFKEIIN